MKKMREKYNLFTAIVICFLVYVVLSWLIPTGSISSSTFTAGSTDPVGLFGLFYYPGITIGTFIQFGLIILAIGAFYGVMNKTGMYSSLVDGFVKKFTGNEKTFLIVTIGLLAILSSLLGLPYALLIVVPFLMGVLTKLGFNKITTVASTVGSILIGNIGSTFGYTIAGISSSLLGLEISSGILFRLFLLIIILFLFVLFVTGSKEVTISKKKVDKKVKTAKKGTKKETIAEPVIVEEKAIFLEDEIKSNKKPFALQLIFVLTFVLAVVSMFNWNEVFGITLFEDFYENVIGITVSDYPLLQNFLGLTNPFGYWDSYELVGLLIVASLILGWVYSLSLVDVFEGMKAGAKRLLKPACLMVIANIVFALMLSASDGTMLVFITEKLGTMSESFNLFAVSAIGIIGSFFYNNFYYFMNAIGTGLSIHVDSEYYTIMAFILQSMYGLMMMILPTSLILVGGLSMQDVSYKEWIKYIWKFILQLLLIIIILTVILVLVV